jgi:hypothetical protein
MRSTRSGSAERAALGVDGVQIILFGSSRCKVQLHEFFFTRYELDRERRSAIEAKGK